MKKLTTFLFLSLFMWQALAQDAHFSQYFSNPIYLNPAFAGYEGCPRINTAYRLQWPNISGNHHMANVSYDQMIGETHGLAINYQFDIGGGTLQTHGISFAYAPAIRLFKNKLVISPAVELGWRSNFIDWSNLTYGEMIDPRYGFVSSQNTQAPNSQVHMFDMNAGILLSHHDFVYGAAFSHLTQPNESFSGTSKLPIKYTAHISYFWNIHPSVQLSPAFIYLQQQDFRQFLPSLSIWMYGARIGTAYRANLNISDAIIFMAGYQGKGFKVGYSYDLTVSSLSNNTGGSHEISLGYVFNCKKKEFRKGVRQISF